MMKKLIKLSVIILTILMLPAYVFASGKMEVNIGEKVTLQGEDIQSGSTYKWVVKKAKEIISTQTSPIFNYTFLEQGEYDVNMTVTDANNNIKNTSIYILAGDRYPRPASTTEDGGQVEGNLPPEEMPLTVSLSTLPVTGSDGTVHLIGDSGRVFFNIEVIRTDVIEYRIDRNIFADSDGNGVANDDVDNASDNSYLLGGVWETEYKQGEATKIVAEVTLVTRDGKKTKQQVEIVFDPAPRRDGDPLAILDITPAPNADDQLVRLYGDKATVAFYARKSEGKILEFRIDKDIFMDSNGDGNPSNDIDNLNDISFKTGDVWKTTYDKTDRQIIAQLIVVGEGGKGSRIQRGLLFTDKPVKISETEDQIKLVADKDFVLKGDPIKFSIEGLTQPLPSYKFDWDFDGNDEVDKEIEADNTADYIYDFAGVYTVKVTVTDTNKNSAGFTKEVLVKDVASTLADFTFETEGNTIKFTDKSSSALNLTDKNLEYTWNFGDTDPEGYEKQKDQIGIQNPNYTYNKAGSYVVTLTVTDADKVTSVKSAQITIEKDLVTEVPTEETQPTTETEEEGGGSIGVTILKVLLYIILIVIVLAVLMVAGFFVFMKVQHSDLTFEEIVNELKIKILGMLGIHDLIGHPTEDQPINLPEETVQPKSEEKVEEGEVIEKPTHEEVAEPPLAKPTGPVPDWMKDAMGGGTSTDDTTGTK